jgi:AcrR family transcriptional regulator
MTDPHTGRRAKGRPRDRRVDRSLLDAALALLAEGGPDALTIDAVAARAGVARTTVYRRWSGKDELVVAVLDDVAARLIPAPNLGDTRTDLIAIVETAIRVVGDPEVRSIIAALVSELPSNRALAQRFRRRGTCSNAESRGESYTARSIWKRPPTCSSGRSTTVSCSPASNRAPITPSGSSTPSCAAPLPSPTHRSKPQAIGVNDHRRTDSRASTRTRSAATQTSGVDEEHPRGEQERKDGR